MGRLVEKRSEVILTGSSSPAKEYFTRVAKYIPAEVVAFYVSLMGFVAAADPKDHSRVWCAWFAFALGLIMTPVYLYKMADRKSATVAQLIVSTIAFAVWAYALGGPFAMADIHKPLFGAVALASFTFVVGAFQPK